MSRLVKLILVVVIVAFVYSTGMAAWRAFQFDGYFAGYLQKAGRMTQEELEADLIELATQNGIHFEREPVKLDQVEDRFRVTFFYQIPIGIGGFSYLLQRSMSGTTSFGEAFGVPQGIDQMPRSSSHAIRGLRDRPAQVKSQLRGSSK
jgi:hypothetical protein